MINIFFTWSGVILWSLILGYFLFLFLYPLFCATSLILLTIFAAYKNNRLNELRFSKIHKSLFDYYLIFLTEPCDSINSNYYEWRGIFKWKVKK